MRRLGVVVVSVCSIIPAGLAGLSTTALGAAPHGPAAKTTCTATTKKVNGKKTTIKTCTSSYTLKGAEVGGFMAVDAQGDIYGDSASDGLLKISPKGMILARWAGLKVEADHTDIMAGVALDAAGNVYVADSSANRVVKLSPDLQVEAQWGSYGPARGQFTELAGLTVDAQANIFVVDSGNDRIQKLGPDGSVLAVWDKQGLFLAPQGITTDRQGNVYVADGGFGILKLSPSGDLLATWNNSAALGFQFAGDVAVDASGNVYVADEGQAYLFKLSPAGKQLDYWLLDPQRAIGPVGLAIDPHGALYTSACPGDPSYSKLCQEIKLSSKAAAVITWRSSISFPAPGSKINIGGYSLYLHCTGEGSPTVILESWYGGDSSEWEYIQPELDRNTRVCSYDRAGHYHSDPRPSTITSSGLQIAQELHALLQKANIGGPYILVGDNYGGTYNRLFTATYPSEVAGLVQIDAPTENTCTAIGDQQCAPNGGELDSFITTFNQLKDATHGTVKGSLGALPLVVLTESPDVPGVPCDANCQKGNGIWQGLQNELATASSNNVHVIATRSPGSIAYLQPGLVIEAANEVLGAARAASHQLPACGTGFQALGGQCAGS